VNLPGDSDSWDFGIGAGFYVDAIREPWARHFRMYSYITSELPALIEAHFPADAERTGVFGHSTGGHGAIMMALKNPKLYRSISAFAPIAAPKQCPWGDKAFVNYLGTNRDRWDEYDSIEIMLKIQDAVARPPILIDQGTDDQFLKT
jgi:S-formylglutathione hydrolase